MDAEFRHQDGGFAGQVRVVRKDFATIGRHPGSDVPFDPDHDLDVSGRHAAVFRQGDRWVLRDLGSTNGTWVNGVRIASDRVLEPNDVIRLGAAGPQLTFLPHHDQPVRIPPTRPDELRVAPADPSGTAPPRGAVPPEPSRGSPGGGLGGPEPGPALTPRHVIARLESREPPPDEEPPPPAGPTTIKIQAEVRRQTTGARRVAAGALITALAALVVLGGWEVRRNRAMAEERALLLARTDSLLGRIETTTTTVQGLKTDLSAARGETEELRAAIADKEMTLKRLDSLSRRLAASLARHQAVLRAARFDVQAVARDNSDAVGVVLSEFAGGHKVAGTGFAIRVRDDTGWVLTCRHLIADSAGRSPARLGVIFNGSNQNFRAELLPTSQSADLAILRVRVRHGIPFVRGLASSSRPGDAVAVFGFPFGFDSPPGPDWQRFGVSATSTPGTIRSATPTLLEVDGYGASGSSGSPIFDSAGEVVGVVFGGERGTAGRTLYAVPARQVAELLRKAEAEKK